MNWKKFTSRFNPNDEEGWEDYYNWLDDAWGPIWEGLEAALQVRIVPEWSTHNLDREGAVDFYWGSDYQNSPVISMDVMDFNNLCIGEARKANNNNEAIRNITARLLKLFYNKLDSKKPKKVKDIYESLSREEWERKAKLLQVDWDSFKEWFDDNFLDILDAANDFSDGLIYIEEDIIDEVMGEVGGTVSVYFAPYSEIDDEMDPMNPNEYPYLAEVSANRFFNDMRTRLQVCDDEESAIQSVGQIISRIAMRAQPF